MSDSIEIAVIVQAVRPKAIQVTDTVNTGWLPRSQIIEPDEDDIDELGKGEEIELTIPEWLAIEKGFA